MLIVTNTISLANVSSIHSLPPGSHFDMSSASTNNSSYLKSEEVSSRSQMTSDTIAAGVFFALAMTVGQKIIGFVRGVLFCRFMTDQELGQWSMVWSFLMLLAPLAVLGLPGCFGRFSEYYRSRGQLRTFIMRIAAVSTVMTIAIVGSIAAYPGLVSKLIFGSDQQTGVVFAMAVALIIVSLSNFLSSLMESLRQIRTVTAMRFLTGIVFAVVGSCLIWVWDDSASAAAVGYAVACIVGIVPAVWVLWKFRGDINNHGDDLGHAEMWKRIAPFAIWLWASNLCHNFFEVSDRYMLIHWSDTTADLAQGFVGQYHSGRVVPLLFVSVATMLGGVLLPFMSAHWEAGNPQRAIKQLNWTVKLVSLSFTAGGIVVMLLSPLLFHVILQGRYDEGMKVLPLTLVYCTWFCLFIVGQDYLWVAEKGKWAAFAIFIGLAANIVFNMLLIPTMGLKGAVVATTLGNLLNLLMIFGFNHHFGCRADAGIWACVATPLLMIVNPIMGVACMIGLVTIAWGSDWFFSVEEKTEIHEAADAAMVKLLAAVGRR